MDLTTYLCEGHFEREMETLMEHPEKHGLIYLAHGGKKDINLVKEFQQKMLVEYIPTIKTYASARKSDVVVNVLGGKILSSCDTCLRTHIVSIDERK